MAILWKVGRPGMGFGRQRQVVESEVDGGVWLEEAWAGELLREGTHLVGHRPAGITAKVSRHVS